MTGSDLWDKSARQQALAQLTRKSAYPVRGRVHKVVGPMLEASGLSVEVGRACRVQLSSKQDVEAEVVGFRGDYTLLMPVGLTRGIAPGNPVQPTPGAASIHISDALLGRVLDACGRPLDGMPLALEGEPFPIHRRPPNPMARQLIDEPMQLGVRALDACLTMGWGQRMGLFAGAGVGKSTLLGMLARNSDAEINVIALVGERGRELREFLERALGEEAMSRCIVVVATSDAPPLMRVRAALAATTIAEAFRDRGRRVMLLMDSLTRFLQAQREIGLMLGEPPTSKGYTPSCFSMLAELIERAGPGDGGGNLSALYTVLVEGDDLTDPVADAALAVLDGHVVLDRRLAERGHFPAIHILGSVSRLANSLTSRDVQGAARSLREELALFERMEDMVNMGAYEQGSNPRLDRVIERLPAIREFLTQDPEHATSLKEGQSALISLMEENHG
ncbi:MAG TPA: FliI/YscN family ATPase [Mariprofundaceae bacterium]|nr:FliI/YscN family ATPase [Mariprofundaceae bacterium]